MIGSHELGYVFVAIPRTASTSVRQWLKKYHQGRKITKDHSCVVPGDYKGYFIFTIVRNPYARCYSFWAWDNKRHSLGVSLAEYLRWMIEQSESSERPSSYITQSEYVRQAKVDIVLRFEELPSSLRSLSFIRANHRLPHYRRGVAMLEPMKQHYTDEELELLWQYCSEDFNFGYDK